MDLINVASVKEMKMQFRVKFELSLEWFEPRLRWRDLQNNSNLNIIPLNNLPEVRILLYCILHISVYDGLFLHSLEEVYDLYSLLVYLPKSEKKPPLDWSHFHKSVYSR